jgi:hypothetical protein
MPHLSSTGAQQYFQLCNPDILVSSGLFFAFTKDFLLSLVLAHSVCICDDDVTAYSVTLRLELEGTALEVL